MCSLIPNADSFFLPDGVFLPCNHGVDIRHKLIMWEINQSSAHTSRSERQRKCDSPNEIIWPATAHDAAAARTQKAKRLRCVTFLEGENR